VSPRRGGETDKFGNRYEGRWTVRQILSIVSDEFESINVEPLGEIGRGVEFTLRRASETQVHQVKRQHGVAPAWDLPSLKAKDVLEHAQRHIAAGRQFYFISVTPSPVLEELARRARQAPDLQTFLQLSLTNEDLRRAFDYLRNKGYGSDEIAWTTLRGLHVDWTSEEFLQSQNEALAGLLLQGAEPRLMTAGLGDLIAEHTGVELDAGKIEALLADYGLRPRSIIGSDAVRDRLREITAGWRSSVGARMLNPPIPRTESDELVERLREDPDRLLFVAGTAGSGKSAVLFEAVGQLEAESWPVLALRLDRLDPFATPQALGRLLELDVSPVSALAAVANGSPSVLVIDQLDAVSFASGRMPQTFDVIADIIRQSAAFPEMRLVLACRQFDSDHDDRIRALMASAGVGQLTVGPLTDDQVNEAVAAMDLDPSSLTAEQRKLLRVPLHLVLLRTIADQPGALSFTSSRQLFDEYWNRKRRDCEERRPGTRFAEAIGVVATAMSSRQRLTAPQPVLDQHELQADGDLLISSHVLVLENRQLAFFHEAFFDYAFARQWTNDAKTLVDFLRQGEQELFRRSQVRQILLHLREDDPDRYLTELEAVLSEPQIRFHIKDTVLAFLGSLPDSTTGEWEVLSRLLATKPPFTDRLWLTIRTPGWFERLDAEGLIAAWLASSDEMQQRQALDMMVPAARPYPDRLAELLRPFATRQAGYVGWLAWATRFANLYESRPLFHLVVEAVRRGDYQGREPSLWMATHGLGQQRPEWAVELLAAYLLDRPGSFEVNDAGQIAGLESDDNNLLELTDKAASGAAETFCQRIVPYLLTVMQLTEDDLTQRPVTDRHFSYRSPGNGPLYRLDDALLRATGTALRPLASADPEATQPILETLAADQHESAQWLLYESLLSVAERQASWAAELLLEGDYRLVSGYSGNRAWTVRQLLQAIWPYLDAAVRSVLEQAIVAVRPPGASDKAAGWTSFTLLSGLPPETLSENARQRLNELRQQFEVDQPGEPTGTEAIFVGSPIPPKAARAMTDEEWLAAMRKYSGNEPGLAFLSGSALELSQVLKSEVAAEPERFAQLALQFTPDMHPAYGTAVLQTLADTSQPIEPQQVFDVVRHIASLGHEEYQDWLGWPVRRYRNDDIPDDIIEIILDRVLHAASPAEEVWLPTETREASYGGDIYASGMNAARGQSALVLGDLLLADRDGHRTALVVPSLQELAGDPSVSVRSCVGHLLLACRRHARPESTAAFWRLIETDDRLLAAQAVMDLMIYVGNDDPPRLQPVIERMLSSEYPAVREAGGKLAAFTGLEFGLDGLLAASRQSPDGSVRKGAAEVCARRLGGTADPVNATAALSQFFTDDDEDVRKSAAQAALTLRGQALRPFADLLSALIQSPSFTDALSAVLMTLEQAPDRIDDLVISCAKRFLQEHGSQVGDLSTAAAGQAQGVGRLILRAYTQATTPAGRAAVLDLVDELLMNSAYDFARIVDEAER
jgi:hypothetical protein